MAEGFGKLRVDLTGRHLSLLWSLRKKSEKQQTTGTEKKNRSFHKGVTNDSISYSQCSDESGTLPESADAIKPWDSKECDMTKKKDTSLLRGAQETLCPDSRCFDR